MLLSFCLNFCQCQPGAAYKSVDYKKVQSFDLIETDKLVFGAFLSKVQPQSLAWLLLIFRRFWPVVTYEIVAQKRKKLVRLLYSFLAGTKN